MAAPHVSRHMRASHPGAPPATSTEMEDDDSDPPRQQRRPGAEPKIRKCEHCAQTLHSIAGMVHHIRERRAAARRARAMDENGAKRCTPTNSTAHARDMCGVSCIRLGGLAQHRCRKHDESAAYGTTEFSRLRCGESPHHIMECCGWRRPRAKHGVQAGASEGPGLRLADFLLERMRHAPRPPPITCTTAATALGQDPGRGPPESRRAVHGSVGLAPMTGHL
ncbi:hypothetical protein CGC20_1250 [Leishmania donovani]|uniref:Uncharacterized protein n=1 Tax=Leishmania donovani TaxID=5661 RepID=A0A504XBZ7_LEIDO|nr:hypothetical protein CGC20_1250 [Leishmania donovani]